MTAVQREDGEGVLALLLTGPGSIEPVQIPPPTPLDGEVLVDVDLVGICGSEIHDSRVMEYRRPPIIMGHEMVGRLADGSRVAVDPLIACATCTACQVGRSNVCASRAVLGIHRTGGFTSAIAVPSTQLTLIPSTLSDLRGVMAEPLANGLHAWTVSAASAATRIGIIKRPSPSPSRPAGSAVAPPPPATPGRCYGPRPAGGRSP
jgi:threonine dehydrogenase-like Zn-dependent dehydrogenase